MRLSSLAGYVEFILGVHVSESTDEGRKAHVLVGRSTNRLLDPVVVVVRGNGAKSASAARGGGGEGV